MNESNLLENELRQLGEDLRREPSVASAVLMKINDIDTSSVLKMPSAGRARTLAGIGMSLAALAAVVAMMFFFRTDRIAFAQIQSRLSAYRTASLRYQNALFEQDKNETEISSVAMQVSINAEDGRTRVEMPADPLGRIFLHLSGPKTTKWDEPGFFEGYNRHPAELIVREEGPFYKEVKDDDPDLAVRLVERELTKWLPHEILFDLLLRDELSGVEVKPQDVGVGISQIAPVLVQAFGNQNGLIAVEQPEIHIHPALQAELGDVFIESALGENKNTFLLETHSEHLILRILRRIRESTEKDFSDWSEELKNACGPDGIRPEDVAVLYVQPGENGSEVIELPITPDGDFTRPWPSGFFTERAKELY